MAIIAREVPVQAPEAVASFSIAGIYYSEVLKLRVHRDVNNATGEGEVTLSWPASSVDPLGEGLIPMPAFMDGVRGGIHLDGQLAMTFRFDSRISHGSPTQYELELHFRGLFADGVDGAPKHETGEELDKTPGQICQKLMEGYDAQFTDLSGETRKLSRFVLAQGETVERAMRRCTREFSLNFTENEQGVVELHKKDAAETTGGALILGDNKITHWSVKRDIGTRASEHNLFGITLPNEDKGIWGKNALLSAMASASGFGFQKIRSYLVDSDQDADSAKERAEFEGTRSAAQGLNVTLRVSTWTDVDGLLWKPYARYPVTIPIDGVDETMMLSSVTFVLTPTERYATLVLTSQFSFGQAGELFKITGPSSMTERFEIKTGAGKTPEDEKKKEEEKEDENRPPD
jgi:prophage tail gpP-like protein